LADGRRIAGWFVWSTILACLALAVWAVARTHPVSWSQGLRHLVALGLLTILIPAAMAVGWRSGRRWSVLALPAAFVTAMLAILAAEPLHWRWSRADFEQVADGDRAPCTGTATWPAAIEHPSCELGWWRVTGMTRHTDAVVLWTRSDGCYAGEGLARPTGRGVGSGGIREALVESGVSAFITVTPWRDGWYTVCLTT
jgi:hypothetical protein